MPTKNYPYWNTPLKKEVREKLRKLKYEFSMQINERVTYSDTVDFLIEFYKKYRREGD